MKRSTLNSPTWPASEARPALQISRVALNGSPPPRTAAFQAAAATPGGLLPAVLQLRESIDSLVALLTRDPAEPGPIAMIQEQAAAEFAPDVPLWRRWMTTRERYEPLNTARMVAMRITREVLKISSYETGRSFKRDRGTVIHAIHKIRGLCEADLRFHARYTRVLAAVAARLHPKSTGEPRQNSVSSVTSCSKSGS